MFNFYAKKDDLSNASLASVPAHISWTRLGPWLPWMQLGDREGQLVYHAHGSKLAGGIADLPQELREYVTDHDPQFLHAPAQWSRPNETSWTFFKKKVDSGEYTGAP